MTSAQTSPRRGPGRPRLPAGTMITVEAAIGDQLRTRAAALGLHPRQYVALLLTLTDDDTVAAHVTTGSSSAMDLAS